MMTQAMKETVCEQGQHEVFNNENGNSISKRQLTEAENI